MSRLEENMFDVRTMDLNLKRGKITQRELDKYLKELPDEKGRSEELVVYKEDKAEKTPSR